MLVKKIIVDKANRLYQLPPDLLAFAKADPKRSLIKRTEVIDLARFRWPSDLNPEDFPPATSFAPASKAKLLTLKEAVADWFYDRHSVRLNPKHEIHLGGGISQQVFNLAIAFVDVGDIVFVPELGLPLYRRSVTACGGQPVHYQLSRKTDWQPQFDSVTSRLSKVARLLFLNSPHNPTGSELDLKGMADLVWIASRENIPIINDAAYQMFSGRKSASILEVEGGKKVAIELYGFSYTFGMPLLPFGFAVGNRDLIEGLHQASQMTVPPLPEYFVDLALEAIRKFPSTGLDSIRAQVAQSASEATKLMELLSLEKVGFDAVPFVWAQLNRRRSAASLASILYRRSRVLVVPGKGFGDTGEGYIRLSLTAPREDYQVAIARIERKIKLIGKAQSE